MTEKTKMADEVFDPNENMVDYDDGLNIDDFYSGQYVKNPSMGETITLVIEKVVANENVDAKNKATGKDFKIGLKQKDGKIKRYDIYTDKGIYTVKNWEIFFKLFGSKDGLLIKYAKEHNKSFKGAVVKLKRLMEGSHVNYTEYDLSKVLGISIDEAVKYKQDVVLAVKEQRLFEVEVQ